MRLVIFDIDGTLVSGLSTERRFFLRLVRTGNQGPRQLLAYLAFLVRWSGLYGRDVLKKNKAYLTLLSSAKVRRLAAEWVAGNFNSIAFRPCVERLRSHLANGDEVVLVSGTPDFLAAGIAEALGVAHAIGSRCAERAGLFRFGRPVLHPFGRTKLSVAQELCEHYGVTLDQVTAYADTRQDLPLLEAVGTPVAVRPDNRLAAVARERGWEVIGTRDRRRGADARPLSTS
jgi:HAD superfamily hydrolase (TIGR01490 family)